MGLRSWSGGFCGSGALCGGFHHFEALDFAAGIGVGDIAADDLVFVDQDRGIDRICGAGEILHLIDIAHHIFAGKLA